MAQQINVNELIESLFDVSLTLGSTFVNRKELSSQEKLYFVKNQLETSVCGDYKTKKCKFQIISKLIDLQQLNKTDIEKFLEWLSYIIDDKELSKLGAICFYKLFISTNLQIDVNKEAILNSVTFFVPNTSLLTFCRNGCQVYLGNTMKNDSDHKDYIDSAKSLLNEIVKPNGSILFGYEPIAPEMHLHEIYKSLFKYMSINPIHQLYVDEELIELLPKKLKLLDGTNENLLRSEMKKYFTLDEYDIDELNSLKVKMMVGQVVIEHEDVALIVKVLHHLMFLKVEDFTSKSQASVKRAKIGMSSLALLHSIDKIYDRVSNILLKSTFCDAVVQFIDSFEDLLRKNVNCPELADYVSLLLDLVVKLASISTDFVKLFNEVNITMLTKYFVLNNTKWFNKNDSKIKGIIKKILILFYHYTLNQQKSDILVRFLDIVKSFVDNYETLINTEWNGMILLIILYQFDKNTLLDSIDVRQIIKDSMKLVNRCINGNLIVDGELMLILDRSSKLNCRLIDLASVLNMILKREDIKKCITDDSECEELVQKFKNVCILEHTRHGQEC